MTHLLLGGPRLRFRVAQFGHTPVEGGSKGQPRYQLLSWQLCKGTLDELMANTTKVTENREAHVFDYIQSLFHVYWEMMCCHYKNLVNEWVRKNCFLTRSGTTIFAENVTTFLNVILLLNVFNDLMFKKLHQNNIHKNLVSSAQ